VGFPVWPAVATAAAALGARAVPEGGGSAALGAGAPAGPTEPAGPVEGEAGAVSDRVPDLSSDRGPGRGSLTRPR